MKTGLLVLTFFPGSLTWNWPRITPTPLLLNALVLLHCIMPMYRETHHLGQGSSLEGQGQNEPPAAENSLMLAEHKGHCTELYWQYLSNAAHGKVAKTLNMFETFLYFCSIFRGFFSLLNT